MDGACGGVHNAARCRAGRRGGLRGSAGWSGPFGGAVPLDAIDAKTAEEVAPDKDAPVLVYCRSGVRSAEAAQKLSDLGYAQVYDFGGILDWPYATVEGAETVQSGLPEGEMPVGVKVVCGKTRSLPED